MVFNGLDYKILDIGFADLVVIPSGCSDIAVQRTVMVASAVDPCAMDTAHSTKKSFHGIFDVMQPAEAKMSMIALSTCT